MSNCNNLFHTYIIYLFEFNKKWIIKLTCFLKDLYSRIYVFYSANKYKIHTFQTIFVAFKLSLVVFKNKLENRAHNNNL